MTSASFLRDAVASSTAVLLDNVDAIDDEAMGRPTALPDWTRAHVLSHLARNADGLLRMLVGALAGHTLPMYPSRDARNADIAAGAGRPPDVIRQDVRLTAEALAAVGSIVPAERWTDVVTMRAPIGTMELPLEAIFDMRLGELEIHQADLDIGYDFSATAPASLARLIGAAAVKFGGRVPAPIELRATDTGQVAIIDGADATGRLTVVELPAGALYRQLTGRLAADDTPDAIPGLPAWG